MLWDEALLCIFQNVSAASRYSPALPKMPSSNEYVPCKPRLFSFYFKFVGFLCRYLFVGLYYVVLVCR
jgi:hypothetical protein